MKRIRNWRKALSKVPKYLRKQYGFTQHMRARPSGMPREQWVGVWVQKYAGVAENSAAPRPKRQPRTKRLQRVTDDAFLFSFEWRQLRMQVIKKRGARCECCGASPSDGVTVINVDHIKPRRDFPELALTESNLQVLCAVCNHGKGNWDRTDWRTVKELEISDADACRVAEKYRM